MPSLSTQTKHQPFGHNRHGSIIARGLCPFGGAGSPSIAMWPQPRPISVTSGILIHAAVWVDPHLTLSLLGRDLLSPYLNPTKWHLHPFSPLTTTEMGRKLECCAPFWCERAGSPCNTMSLGPRPTSLPSGTLIHPTVWPQYTNVADRTGQVRQTTV